MGEGSPTFAGSESGTASLSAVLLSFLPDYLPTSRYGNVVAFATFEKLELDVPRAERTRYL